MKKKLFSIIMCVLMVMCFMPTAAFAGSTVAGATVDPISVMNSAGTMVTLNNNQYLSTMDTTTATDYVAEATYVAKYVDGKLYLNGYNLNATVSAESSAYAISGENYEIVVESDSTVKLTTAEAEKTDTSYKINFGGIFGYGVTISGDATLNLNIESKANGTNAFGMRIRDDLTATAPLNVTVKSSAGGWAKGILVFYNTITLSGADKVISATGASSDAGNGNAFGIQNYKYSSGENAGDVNIACNLKMETGDGIISVGIDTAGDVEINNADVTISSSVMTKGIRTTAGNIEVKNSSVKIDLSDTSASGFLAGKEDADGVFEEVGTVAIEDSTVDMSTGSSAIRAKTVNIKNTVATLDVTDMIYAIDADSGEGNNIDLSEGGCVTLKSPYQYLAYNVFLGTDTYVATGSTEEVGGVTGSARVVGADVTEGEDTVKIAVIKTAKVAEINGTKYNSLATAISAAETGQTIKLLDDITADVVIPADKDVTLDLNGHKLTNETSDTIKVNLGATLTIEDTSTGKTGKVDNVTKDCATVFNNGTVILNGGTFDRSQEKGTQTSDVSDETVNTYYTIVNHGTMTINDGVTVQTAGGNATYGKACSLIDNGYKSYGNGSERVNYVNGTNAEEATLNINGGSFTGGYFTVRNYTKGTLEITGGDFVNTTACVVTNYNNATIKGGKFTCTVGTGIMDMTANKSKDAGKLKISGGEINAKNAVSAVMAAELTIEGGTFNGSSNAIKAQNLTGSITVSGGTFNTNPTAYVASGYAAVGNTDGTWTVKKTSDKITVDPTAPEGTTKVTDKTKEGQTTVTETTADKTTTTVTTDPVIDKATGTTTTTETKLEVKTENNVKVETKTEATTVKTTNVETTEAKVTTKKGDVETVVTTKSVKDEENKTEVKTTVEGTKATAEAKVESPASSKDVITVDATAAAASTEAVKTVEVKLPAATVEVLKEAAGDTSKNVETVELKTNVATLEISNTALKTLTKNASGEKALVLTVAKKDTTATTTPGASVESQDTVAAEKDSTVTAAFELTATIGGDAAFTSDNSNSNGNITINVSYPQPASNKTVKVYYVNPTDGSKTNMNASYRENVLTWSTNHFSTFQVEESEKPVTYGGGSSSKPSSVDKTEDIGDTGAIDDKDSKSTAVELAKALSFKARSSKTSKGSIKVKLTVDDEKIQDIEALGYTVKYKFYRSTKKASSYKAMLEKAGKTYTNTTGKKGTRYYYKARVMVYDSDGTLIAKSALTQCKYASRIK